MPMTLIGIAIIGKNNEPLYLCDLANLPVTQSEDVLPLNDPFGFQPTQSEQRSSLPLSSQLVIYAALDFLEELIVTSVTQQQPVIKRPYAAMACWVGHLFELEGQSVYGYITATNIKFLAMVSGKCEIKVMQQYLRNIHEHYVTYIINPFSNTRGPIMSDVFDKNVLRETEKLYSNKEIQS